MIDVKLVSYSPDPLSLAVASARTCYSQKIILPKDLKPSQIDRIGKSIYSSGHHTPFQHAHFTFAISNVSRHFVWEFLHNHPYYNTEQTSQRYNVVAKDSFYIPPNLSEKAHSIYTKALEFAFDCYQKITHILEKEKEQLAFSLGRVKRWNEETTRKDLQKKAIENSRYVLPIAAYTNLYHTVSLLVLQRYVRMMNLPSTSEEARRVIYLMLEEIKKICPEYSELIAEKPYQEQELPEYILLKKYQNLKKTYERFSKNFDQDFKYVHSQLVSYTANPELIIASALEQSLGLSFSPEEALEIILNPKNNSYLNSTLNVSYHSPLMQALWHVSYTFKKKMSHCADSQNQRHRGTPGSRPMLHILNHETPDYVIPFLIQKSESLALYKEAMEYLWEAKNQLVEEGVPLKNAIYMLPNATTIRFIETSPLIHLVHKIKMRTCFNAQYEINHATMEELQQINSVHRNIGKYLGPPCFMNRDLEVQDPLIGPCTEGPRWCGVKVWLNWPMVKRPF